MSLMFAVVVGMGVVGGTQASASVTTISVLSAEVSVRHGEGAPFVMARDGEVLRAGDAIRTDGGGRAVLTYFEGSSVTIEPGTELVIDRADGNADGSTVVLMTQTIGRTWHVVTKLITGGSKYEVRTPASTASVRGTEFEVVVGVTATTVTTTGGTVVDAVADPARPGAVVEIPVPAGMTHEQPRSAAPTRPRRAEAPASTVTVTVDAVHSLVIDPQGRANGFTRNDKLVIQTPGASVRREDGRVVVTLPDVADGRIATLVERNGGPDRVRVHTRVDDHGRVVELDDVVQRGRDRRGATAVELRSGGLRVAGDARLPSPKVDTTPLRTARPGKGTETARPADRRAAPPTLRQSDTPRPTSRVTGTPKPADTPRSTETRRP